MANPVARHFTINKLLQGYPEEVLFQMELAKEYIFHVGVEPRDGLLLQGDIPTPETLSRGEAPGYLAPLEPTDAERSLGVRMWSACQKVVDDVYGEPVRNQWEYKPPIRTMGYLEFSEEANEEITFNEFGQVRANTARMWIPVLHHLENGYVHPKEGDVVEFWGRSWHEMGYFYDVVKVSRDGYINDTNYWVQWILELRRNDNFLPERKVLAALGEAERTPVDPVLPAAPEFDGSTSDIQTTYKNEAFVVSDVNQYIFTLEESPLTNLDIDVAWNGINLVPGAGFGTYLPDVFGFVIQSGNELRLSSNIDLTVDDVIAIGYYFADS